VPLGGLGICGGGSEKPGSRRSCGGVASGFHEDEERSECVRDVGVMGRGGMKSGGGLAARTVEDAGVMGRGGTKIGGALFARTVEVDDSDDSGVVDWL